MPLSRLTCFEIYIFHVQVNKTLWTTNTLFNYNIIEVSLLKHVVQCKAQYLG